MDWSPLERPSCMMRLLNRRTSHRAPAALKKDPQARGEGYSAVAPGQGELGSQPHSRRYLWSLLGMLLSATIFEGYDITIFHLCTPDIAHTFQMGDAAVGAMATMVRFGGILSFFVVTLADCYGRKRVLSNTVLCYALFTLLTALSTGVWSFALFQSSAQVFLAAEFGLAVTMIS